MTPEEGPDYHPMDEHIGNLNSLAIALAMNGDHETAKVIASAAEALQSYIVKLEILLEG